MKTEDLILHWLNHHTTDLASASEIAQNIGEPVPIITKLLDKLTRKRLVERTMLPHPVNNRRTWFYSIGADYVEIPKLTVWRPYPFSHSNHDQAVI